MNNYVINLLTKYKVEKVINVRKQLKEDNPKLYKKIPSFALSILEKIIHQKQINVIVDKYKETYGIEFLGNIIKEFNVTIKKIGAENLPSKGRYVYCANHPIGVFDGLAIVSVIGENFDSVKSIGNEAFLLVPNLRPIIAMVNVYGRSPKKIIEALGNLYASDSQICNFPSGEVSRVIKGNIIDGKWQKSFIGKSIEYKRDIVPIHIDSRNSSLFYNIYKIRKFFGIKANVELSLLSHEMFTKTNKTIPIIIGKPISYKTLDKRHSHNEWAQIIRKYVYSLKTGKEEFNY